MIEEKTKSNEVDIFNDKRDINNMQPQYIIPQWPVADSVKSLVTTRKQGVSLTPWDSFNLALHVKDNPLHVQQNREILNQHIPAEPFWLDQTHSQTIIEVDDQPISSTDNCPPNADGSYSLMSNQVCCVLTADCLPILFCTENAAAVAAVHAGWRGLASGIIDNAVKLLCNKTQLPAKHILVWLGPAISNQHFEVGAEVRQQFIAKNPQYETAFTTCLTNENNENKYMADMYLLARLNLQQMGVNKIYGGNFCSYGDKENFYSYRRDGITGRMASLIWKTD